MTRITVHAKPKAKKTRLVRVDGLRADVALAAPPVDGRANDELIAFLADVLGVPKRSLTLASGASSRSKVVAVDGLDEGEVAARLAARCDA